MKSLSTTKRYISLVLNLAVIITELIGFVQSSVIHGLSLFQFYTEDSNLFALFTSALLVIFLFKYRKSETLPGWIGALKYMSVCYLCVTFIVVIAVLAPMTGGVAGYRYMLLEGSMLYHHFLCPVAATITFLFFDPIPPIRRKSLYISLIPTALYATVMIILNIFKLIDGPYPFLRVYHQPVYVSCIWFVVILGLVYLLSWLLQTVHYRLHKTQNLHM